MAVSALIEYALPRAVAAGASHGELHDILDSVIDAFNKASVAHSAAVKGEPTAPEVSRVLDLIYVGMIAERGYL